eukprot:4236197-Amphidinium_carterae.1
MSWWVGGSCLLLTLAPVAIFAQVQTLELQAAWAPEKFSSRFCAELLSTSSADAATIKDLGDLILWARASESFRAPWLAYMGMQATDFVLLRSLRWMPTIM